MQLYIIRDSARRIRIIYNTCIDTNRVESLRHPRSPLNSEIYPRHICKEDSSDRYIINDGRLRAGHARVATRQGVEWRKTTKNTLQYFEDEADYRLYVGINAVVYNLIFVKRSNDHSLPLSCHQWHVLGPKAVFYLMLSTRADLVKVLFVIFRYRPLF